MSENETHIHMSADEYEKLVKRSMTFGQAAKALLAIIAFLFIGGWSASTAIADYATKEDLNHALSNTGDTKARSDIENIENTVNAIGRNVKALSENQIRNEMHNELNYYSSQHTEKLMGWYVNGRRGKKPTKNPRQEELEAKLIK